MPTYRINLLAGTSHYVGADDRIGLRAWLCTTGLERWLCKEPRVGKSKVPAETTTGYPSPEAHLWRLACVRKAMAADDGAALLNTVLEILGDLDDTGGLERPDGRETKGLVADPQWSDLADSYRKLCSALGLKPLVEYEL